MTGMVTTLSILNTEIYSFNDTLKSNNTNELSKYT